jgi:putative methyltransferase (TIGR04325 family)
MKIKEMVRLLTPPIVWQIAKKRFSKRDAFRLSGNYQSWEQAQADSTGYSSVHILEKTKKALLSVKNGEAVYERDSVLFDHIEYSWPLLAGLLWRAAKSQGHLNVLDFGGSLGSSYFQNLYFLRSVQSVRWNIVEQISHVEVGKQFFEDEHLRFYLTIEECFANTNPNVIILSSVLQYLEKPYDLLLKLSQLSQASILIDRTPFWNNPEDRLCIEKVNASIYPATYPIWIFSLSKFQKHLDRLGPYQEFDSFENGLCGFSWKGYITRINE